MLVKDWHGLAPITFVCMYTSAKAVFTTFFGMALVRIFSQLSRAYTSELATQTICSLFLFGYTNFGSTISQAFGASLLFAPGNKRWQESLELALIVRAGISLVGLICCFLLPVKIVQRSPPLLQGAKDEEARLHQKR